MHYVQLQLHYKSMQESVNQSILYNKFVTGPSSTQQTFFMETRNALRAAFISPESNDNLPRNIAWNWKYIVGMDAHFQQIRVIHIANNIPFLASNKNRQCVFWRTTHCTCCPAVCQKLSN